ncbi:MAG TPA: DUF928 domain-containing protein [Verrucomicrobiae bacterium]|nr:DUF928 domain-containing protein [Verrucomicrobiae bacterium]
MPARYARYFQLIAILAIFIPGRLDSAESTNQVPPLVSIVKTNEAESSKQALPPLPVVPSPARIVYKPPLRGAPAVRIDGGSRGSGVSLICLNVLAPDHTGLTIHEQPTLFWYQSEPADVPFEMTVIEPGKPQPLLRIRLPNARRNGIQHVRLADHGVRLMTGVEYEWVVALVVDPESRSKDVVASGLIQRIEPSAALTARLASASKEDRPVIYAEEGLWYDALEILLTGAQSGDPSAQVESAALLSQAGLSRAAHSLLSSRANLKRPEISP